MNKDKLSEILRNHKQWLDGVPGGKLADLQYADLQNADLQLADLRYANLQGANLQDTDLQYANLQDTDIDYSCWPLWCGSLDVKVDARIARQLAYHFCRLDCDDLEYQAAREVIKDFANKFHRAEECGEINGGETKEDKKSE